MIVLLFILWTDRAIRRARSPFVCMTSVGEHSRSGTQDADKEATEAARPDQDMAGLERDQGQEGID